MAMTAFGGFVVVFLGPPGCGKGTASDLLKLRCGGDVAAAAAGVIHLSTGDLLREAVAAGTDTGNELKETMKRGELVADKVVIELIAGALQPSRLATAKGIVFDGFPRTVDQATALDEMLARIGLPLQAAVYFRTPETVLEERICGRRVHSPSGRSYHVKYKAPKSPGLDDITGEALEQRPDDSVEVLRRRLEQYHLQTDPVCDFYREKNLLREVDASRPIDDVFQAVCKVVGV